VRYLYIGEIGYGNLGDDACAYLVKRILGDGLVLKSFSEFGQEMVPDVLLIGGGTLLSMGGPSWMEILRTAAKHARRTVVLGTGIDPGIPWSEKGIRCMQELMGYVEERDRGVRGPISKAALSAIGVSSVIVGDPMFLYKPPKFRQSGRVGIVPGHQGRSVGGPHFQERMCAVINMINRPIAYIPVWIRDVGLEKAYQAETGKGAVYYPGKGLHNVAKQLAGCRAVIVNRMHAGILALVCGVPAFFVAHHVKVTDLCRALSWPHYAPASEGNLPALCAAFVEEAPQLKIPWPQIEGFRKAAGEILERVAHD